jgi:hypothetical protein
MNTLQRTRERVLARAVDLTWWIIPQAPRETNVPIFAAKTQELCGFLDTFFPHP